MTHFNLLQTISGCEYTAEISAFFETDSIKTLWRLLICKQQKTTCDTADMKELLEIFMTGSCIQ